MPRRILIHLVSFNLVRLLDAKNQAALLSITVANHTPVTEGSEGFTATRWVSEVSSSVSPTENEADRRNVFFGENCNKLRVIK